MRNQLLSEIVSALNGSVTNMNSRNDLLADIVLAAGGKITNRADRNALLQDWLDATGGVTPPQPVDSSKFTYNSLGGNRANSGAGYVSIPEVQLAGDFKISYVGTNIGANIGYSQGSSNVIRARLNVVRFSNSTKTVDTSNLSLLKGGDTASYVYKYEFERVNDVLKINIYDGVTNHLVTSLPDVTDAEGVLIIDQFFRWSSANEGGPACKFSIQDLSDPTSNNNRYYELDEGLESDVAIDGESGQNGAWVDRTLTPDKYIITKSGYTLDTNERLKSHFNYDVSTQKVLATFSASVLQRSFQGKENLMQYLYAEQGVDLDFIQFGNGGELIQDAIDDAPSYISEVSATGYTPSNVTSVVHIGGNDTTNSLTYSVNSATNPLITGMRGRLEQLYGLLDAAGYNIIWLPITWRNYGTMPPEDNGSLPYNENIVIPFIRDIVGSSSYENGYVKYDFYQFYKDGFAADSSFLSDAVHPSIDVGRPATREKFVEWFTPLYKS